MLLGPIAVLGTVPIAGGICGISDVRVAGLGFLLAAGLLAVTGGLAFTTRAPAQGSGAARGGMLPAEDLNRGPRRARMVSWRRLVLRADRSSCSGARPIARPKNLILDSAVSLRLAVERSATPHHEGRGQ